MRFVIIDTCEIIIMNNHTCEGLSILLMAEKSINFSILYTGNKYGLTNGYECDMGFNIATEA